MNDPKKLKLLLDDSLLILIMATLACCGLIYEYLLSHYSARILGSVETVIYAIIGIMIVSMGLGAFAAKKVQDAFQGFVVLELTVAFIGCSATLFIASVIGFSKTLPQLIADTYQIPIDTLPQGGLLSKISWLSTQLPYLFAFVLGFLIGMEIPLIARIRETVYGYHLAHNTGTIYGADYICAGVGAAIWVLFMLHLEISQAAALTATLNLFAGFVFLLRFNKHLKYIKSLLLGHVFLTCLILLVFQYGGFWQKQMQNMLYLDKVVYQTQTPYQNLVFTQRQLGGGLEPIYNFYINGRLQFSSLDEQIYHEFLVHPAMQASNRQDNILIIGGGDGLAGRFAHPSSLLRFPRSRSRPARSRKATRRGGPVRRRSGEVLERQKAHEVRMVDDGRLHRAGAKPSLEAVVCCTRFGPYRVAAHGTSLVLWSDVRQNRPIQADRRFVEVKIEAIKKDLRDKVVGRLKKLVGFLATKEVEVDWVDKSRLIELCKSREHQGVVIKTAPYPYDSFDSVTGARRWLLRYWNC